MNTGIIVAGGNSVRFGQDKQLFEIKKIPVLLRTILAFDCSALIDRVVVVTKTENFDTLSELISEYGIISMRLFVVCFSAALYSLRFSP